MVHSVVVVLIVVVLVVVLVVVVNRDGLPTLTQLPIQVLVVVVF